MMRSKLAGLFDGIKYDFRFVKTHTLQPEWYKILKVFILLGFLAGYSLLFGPTKTLLFLGSFLAFEYHYPPDLSCKNSQIYSDLVGFCRHSRTQYDQNEKNWKILLFSNPV